jgi:hypothetical protein
MMDRRQWLKIVLGATAAATIAPLVDLTNATPTFWEQPAIKALKPWRVTFPDGLTFVFDATVVEEKYTGIIDGLMELEMKLHPTGPFEIVQGSKTRHGATVVSSNEDVLMELQEISTSGVTRELINVTRPGDTVETYTLGGLYHIGDIVIKVIGV